MKKMMLNLAVAACLGTLAACASTGAVKPAEADIQQQMTELRRENAELRRLMTDRRVATVDPAASLGDLTPPPPQRRVVPPQNWGWMHQRPQGCSSGVFAMEINNDTVYYLDLAIDGEKIRVRGARGTLPAIPPKTSIFICLGNLGLHSFQGTAYACRGGPGMNGCQMRKVGYVDTQNEWNTGTLFLGRQYAEIRSDMVHDFK